MYPYPQLNRPEWVYTQKPVSDDPKVHEWIQTLGDSNNENHLKSLKKKLM